MIQCWYQVINTMQFKLNKQRIVIDNLVFGMYRYTRYNQFAEINFRINLPRCIIELWNTTYFGKRIFIINGKQPGRYNIELIPRPSECISDSVCCIIITCGYVQLCLSLRDNQLFQTHCIAHPCMFSQQSFRNQATVGT